MKMVEMAMRSIPERALNDEFSGDKVFELAEEIARGEKEGTLLDAHLHYCIAFSLGQSEAEQRLVGLRVRMTPEEVVEARNTAIEWFAEAQLARAPGPLNHPPESARDPKFARVNRAGHRLVENLNRNIMLKRGEIGQRMMEICEQIRASDEVLVAEDESIMRLRALGSCEDAEELIELRAALNHDGDLN